MIEEDLENNDDFRNKSEWLIAAAREYVEKRIKLQADRKILQNQQEDDFVVSSEKCFQDNLI